jgi:hypothetical protein
MTLHLLVRREFRDDISHMSQKAAFDHASASVSSQHPELSSAAARRLTALMLATEPLGTKKEPVERIIGQGFRLKKQSSAILNANDRNASQFVARVEVGQRDVEALIASVCLTGYGLAT